MKTLLVRAALKVLPAVAGILLCAAAVLATENAGDPWAHRLEPLGGQRGSTLELTVVGERLAGALRLEFGSTDLEWIETSAATDEKISGRVRIGKGAALGPHIATVVTKSGRSNARLFYVDQFPSTDEVEPNDRIDQAQPIKPGPRTIQGAMPERVDIDYFSIEATAGERWSFDLRSIEYGGFLECDLTLLDAEGRRVAFNDDKDDYLETPFIEHVFELSGRYLLKLDQYRGPQGVNCGKNCGYMLRISELPLVEAAFPLGGRRGSDVRVSLRGRSLESVTGVYLTRVRGGEYYRLTFPFTAPLSAEEDPSAAALPRIDGALASAGAEVVEAVFSIPEDSPTGLWRLWVESPYGVDDRISLEISDSPELSEADTAAMEALDGEVVVNGSLDRPEEEDVFWIPAVAKRPLVLSTLAVQLGLPSIDTVLELFDESGKLLAEGDDLMTGQGTVIGNPDSFIAYTPERDGRLKLVVRDRIGRGGPTYAYRLKIESRLPRFSLLTDPENINLPIGGEGRMGVLMIREPGFEHGVEVWAEELPAGVEATRERFRPDQFFGPSADGDNVIIPEVFLNLTLAASLTAGDYPIRVFGRSLGADPTVVEAFATLWIGPPRKRNDVRRPMPRILLTAVEAASEPTAAGASDAGASR